MYRFSLFLVVFASLSQYACGNLFWKLPQSSVSPEVRKQIAGSAEFSSGKEAPLSVEVTQAFFSESELKVKVTLRTKADIPSEQVAVLVSGLREGQVVEEQLQPLSEVVSSSVLEAHSAIALLFSLRAQDLTEYQIRCSWGDEAKKLVQRFSAPKTETGAHSMSTPALVPAEASEARASFRPDAAPILKPQVSSSLLLSDVEIVHEALPCQEQVCDTVMTVNAVLINGGDTEISSTSLAVGLYWVEEGKLPGIPRSGSPKTTNEEQVDLQNLRLPAGASRPIRVRIDRSVPLVPGGSFVPHLRILPNSDAL